MVYKKYDFDYETIKKMIESGKSLSQVAEFYNAPKNCAAYFCRTRNIKLNKTNLVGHKHNYFEVQEEIEKTRDSRRWRCKCKCGNFRDFDTYEITKRKTTISCGCYKHTDECIKKNGRCVGFGDIPGVYFNAVKKGAISRGLEYTVTKEEIWEQYLKQNKKCALSGLSLKFNSKSDSTDGTASLDRKDNSKGYTKDNIQWLHKKLNIMKLNSTEAEFTEWCYRVTKYNSSNENIDYCI